MHTAIATVCLSGTLAEKLRSAADAGFDGVEIFEQDLTVSPHSPEQIRERAESLGLSIDLFQPFRDFDATDEQLFQCNLRRLEAKFQLMRRLGCRMILLCSNVSESAVRDDDALARQLRAAGDLAERYDMLIAYEALAWGTYVNRFRHSYDIVMKAKHPRVGICLDSFHILSRGDDPAGIRDLDPERIFFVQLADAPHRDMNLLEWSRHDRVFPGEGELDLPGFVSALSEYRGPVSLEIFNDSFREADVTRTAIDGLRSLTWVADQAGREPLPPAPRVASYDFIEVHTGSLGEVTKILHHLGFRLGGYHRRKTDVQVWSAGSVTIVIRDLGPTGEPTRLHALGISVDDPGSACRRAEELQAQRVERSEEEGELHLPAVEAPDGTEMYFCPPGQEWLREFHAQPGEGESFITGVDHVTLAQPWHRLDEARLFFTSVLGLKAHPVEQVPTPAGLVTSQAMRGGLRLALNVAPEASEQGDFLAASYPEHLTLATNDALAAAQSCVDRGLRILDIPDNYYDDLAARVDLPEATLAELRRLNVLYDADENGEYFHFYTETLGTPGKLYIEVAERRGGYEGYGWADAAVRLAAQYRVLRDSTRGIPS
ncbi:TIM barrel protein [Corynebacterium uropygiale]|uniref:3-dehydroshikimate dehydratase n=1 Tax=Corynebacterium uropygiale TaxID=1775911 RepID=A0A9X1QTE9_9CORY|nr:sugar phosphate isomerase/epimerase and 4-hydroxyphenylpyruvate domain-containing protein [Corynebacterium uropygiale]MCF4007493.1 TIM barrel protein [Corynebacterium uropygiale]